ncbi:glycosyltransferase family 2 protein [candidate division KSB1 bacterium]
MLSKLIRRKRINNDIFTPSVTILMSVYNEEKIIEKKIKNFLELDYPENKLRLIIGSDGSNDKTVEFINKFENERIKLLSFEERRGKSEILNNLIPHSSGDIILFSDANTIYHPEAIKKMMPHFSDSRVGAVCGNLRLNNLDEENVGGWGEKIYWNYENKIKELEGKIKTTIGATGGIYAIRKELFHTIPKNKSIPCDFLIPLRIAGDGYDVVYENEAIAEENTSKNLKGEFIRKVRIGVRCFQMLSYLVPYLNPFKGFVSFGLWSHKIIRWFTPFLMILIFIINLLLIDQTFYKFLFLFQILFYLSAFFGFLLNLFKKKFFIFSAPFYFVTINFALLVGFFKYVFNRQKPIWETAER